MRVQLAQMKASKTGWKIMQAKAIFLSVLLLGFLVAGCTQAQQKTQQQNSGSDASPTVSSTSAETDAQMQQASSETEEMDSLVSDSTLDDIDFVELDESAFN